MYDYMQVWDHFCDTILDEEERKKYSYSEEPKDSGVECGGSASGFKHHSLSVLRIFGFQTQEKFMSYIKNIMEAAVNLENIYLHNKPVCKICQHMVRRPSRYPWTKQAENFGQEQNQQRHMLSFGNLLPQVNNLGVDVLFFLTLD